MTKPKGKTHLTDPFPIVPINHFDRLRNGLSLYDAWQLVGPTIHRNQRCHGFQNLLCIAFIEGMRMALHIKEGDQ